MKKNLFGALLKTSQPQALCRFVFDYLRGSESIRKLLWMTEEILTGSGSAVQFECVSLGKHYFVFCVLNFGLVMRL